MLESTEKLVLDHMDDIEEDIWGSNKKIQSGRKDTTLHSHIWEALKYWNAPNSVSFECSKGANNIFVGHIDD